jgi:hypothetical protein
LKRPLLSAFGVAGLAVVLSGCGSGEPSGTPEAGAVAGPTQRVLANKRFEDPALKKMLLKTGGQMRWSPDMAKKTPGK